MEIGVYVCPLVLIRRRREETGGHSSSPARSSCCFLIIINKRCTSYDITPPVRYEYIDTGGILGCGIQFCSCRVYSYVLIIYLCKLRDTYPWFWCSDRSLVILETNHRPTTSRQYTSSEIVEIRPQANRRVTTKKNYLQLVCDHFFSINISYLVPF